MSRPDPRSAALAPDPSIESLNARWRSLAIAAGHTPLPADHGARERAEITFKAREAA